MYLELNPEFVISELVEFGKKLLSKKLYPAPGIKQLAWYLSARYWGISVSKAETAEDITNNINLWRFAEPSIFKFIKVESALETVQ